MLCTTFLLLLLLLLVRTRTFGALVRLADRALVIRPVLYGIVIPL
jgi:hypothetical protein